MRVERPAAGCRKQPVEAEGRPIPGLGVRLGAALTMYGRVGTTRRPVPASKDRKVLGRTAVVEGAVSDRPSSLSGRIPWPGRGSSRDCELWDGRRRRGIAGHLLCHSEQQ